MAASAKKITAGLFVPFVLALLTASTVLAGDTVKLKDGTSLEGTIAARNDTSVYFVPDDEKLPPRWISLGEVESIRFRPVLVSQPRGNVITGPLSQNSSTAPGGGAMIQTSETRTSGLTFSTGRKKSSAG